MEYPAKRIRSSNAITMQISTIPTIRLTERTAIITQTNVIRITQPTAVAERKTTISKMQPPTELSVGGCIYISAYIFS